MRRRRSVALLLGATACALVGIVTSGSAVRAASPGAPVAQVPVPVSPIGLPGPCDLPGIGSVCSGVGSIIGQIPNPIGAIGGFVAGEAEKSFTHWLADSAASLLGSVLSVADTSLRPDLGSQSAFASQLTRMAGLSGAVALLFLLVTVGQALRHGDPGLIVHALLVRLPLAFAATAALLFITSTAMAAVDQATTYLIGGGVQGSAATLMHHLADLYSVGNFSVSLGLVALCALGTILVGLLLYAEFAVRAALVYLTVLFLPLGLAASVWPGAGRVARRLFDVLVTAILAKFVILATLWLAGGLFDQATGSGADRGFGTFVVGVVVLLLAAGAPMVLLGLVSHAEHAVATVGDTRRAAYGPARRAADVALSAASGGTRAAGRLALAAGGAATAIATRATGGARGGRDGGNDGGGGARPSAMVPASQRGGASGRTRIVAGSGGAVLERQARRSMAPEGGE